MSIFTMPLKRYFPIHRPMRKLTIWINWLALTTTTRGTMFSTYSSLPTKERTSVRISVYQHFKVILFSHYFAGSCPIRSSLHLLWHGHLWWDREGWEGDSLWWHLFLSFWFENDSKVTLEAQLGLIGGTMGLLTGFSILSGVEIIYFVLRFFWFSLRTSYSAGFSCHSRFVDLRWWLQWWQKSRSENHLSRGP